jgi:hypothetical protein
MNVTDKSSLMAKCVCMSIDFSRFGVKRRVDASEIETDADKDMMHVSKDLFDSDLYRAISSYDGITREILKRFCLPSPIKRIKMLPFELITRVDDILKERLKVRDGMIDDFVTKDYVVKSREAKRRLGSLFDQRQYPPTEVVRAAYGMYWQYVTFSTPGKLRQISPEIAERAIKQARESVMQCADEIKMALRAELLKTVNHMCERLEEKPDGSKKIFRDTAVTKVSDFIDVFNARNIVNDEELAKLVEKARKVISGVAPDQLRDSEQVREKVAAQFTAIKKTLDTMIVDRPKRKLNFKED